MPAWMLKLLEMKIIMSFSARGDTIGEYFTTRGISSLETSESNKNEEFLSIA